jgi:hypothetical protein
MESIWATFKQYSSSQVLDIEKVNLRIEMSLVRV